MVYSPPKQSVMPARNVNVNMFSKFKNRKSKRKRHRPVRTAKNWRPIFLQRRAMMQAKKSLDTVSNPSIKSGQMSSGGDDQSDDSNMPAEDGKKMHTHMMFGHKSEVTQKKRSRRPQNRLKEHTKTDTAAQTTPNDMDPTLWTGNQRILHFGPLAQRDPFFYYYPKGWDILYPASFGFFPYRTKKFRGSSPTVCLSAFGTFVLIAGIFMCCFAFIWSDLPPFWTRFNELKMINDKNGKKTTILDAIQYINLPPAQVAGPIFVVVGSICLVFGFCGWICGMNLCNERMRHSQAHHVHLPPRTTEPLVNEEVFDNSPYQPSPPQYTVLANTYTEPMLYNPEGEMKLFPPIGASASLLSLHRHNTPYSGAACNTLGARATSTQPTSTVVSNGHARSQSRRDSRRISNVSMVSVGDSASQVASSSSRYSAPRSKQARRASGIMPPPSASTGAANRNRALYHV